MRDHIGCRSSVYGIERRVWIQFDKGEMRTSEGMEWKIARIGARNLLNQQEMVYLTHGTNLSDHSADFCG